MSFKDDIAETLNRLERDKQNGVVAPSHRSRVEFVQYHEINQGDVDRIFRERLSNLTEGFWCIRAGESTRAGDRKPGWYTTFDMQGRGSDVDEWVAEYNDPRFDVIRAAYELQRALQNRDRARPNRP